MTRGRAIALGGAIALAIIFREPLLDRLSEWVVYTLMPGGW